MSGTNSGWKDVSRWLFVGLAVFTSILVQSCARPTINDALDCFPKEARRWIAKAESEDGFRGRPETSGSVAVYVDSSKSMVGYIDGATETRKPFQDLIRTAPALFRGPASPVSFWAFGTRIRSIAAGQQDQLLNSGFYRCAHQGDEGCDTRLDLVLNEIDAHPERLAIVVTDMWFDDPRSQTTGLVPLADPLANILASGRTIAVYGFRAPFDGTVYNVPPGNQSLRFAGERPLFVLAIGSAERVQEFNDKLSRSASSYLNTSMQRGTAHRALFTLNPATEHRPEAAPLAGGTDARVRRTPVLEAMNGVQVQQFRISRSDALREVEGRPAPPSWQGPADRIFIPGAVWRGPLARRTSVWERRGNQCLGADWLEPARARSGWTDAPQAGQQRFVLDPAQFIEEFRGPGVYLVTAELARTALTQPNEATRWMSDWSFSADEGAPAATAGDPRFFRTVHLSEFARYMENALNEAARRRPGPIVGITFVVEVAD